MKTDFNTDSQHLCEKQLVGNCDTEDCKKIHGTKYGLPYIWQIKLYERWVSLPESQTVKIEKEFCGLKDKSDFYTSSVRRASRNSGQEGIGLTEVWLFYIVFYPKIQAYIRHPYKYKHMKKTEARRISTPSYVDEEYVRHSFKTCWLWFWINDKDTPSLFETDALQYTLEKKYLSGQKRYLYARENYRFKYCLDFGQMTQTNLDTFKSRKIYRRPMLVEEDDIFLQRFPQFLEPPQPLTVPLPGGWEHWDHANPFELVELETSQDSYKECKSLFNKTLNRPIDHIYRVQNPVLWSAFTTHKGNMEVGAERNGRKPDVAERLLFHGTDRLDSVRGIAINNFDHRLSGKNATVYGEGAYFATTARYSHTFTRGPDRFMFLARVLVGKYTTGLSSYKRPPSKPGTTHELYDSCVDSITNPSIFVVFDTKQYYPEFLIQYHSIEQVSEYTTISVNLLQQITPALNSNSSTTLVVSSTSRVGNPGIVGTSRNTQHAQNTSGAYPSKQPSQLISNTTTSRNLTIKPPDSLPVTRSTTSASVSTNTPTTSYRQNERQTFSNQTSSVRKSYTGAYDMPSNANRNRNLETHTSTTTTSRLTEEEKCCCCVIQ